MYKVIGQDQREYGPASAEEIRRWITEGRVNASTMAQSETGIGWKPLHTFPEFASAFAAPPPFSYAYSPELQRTNGMAVAGFVCGLLGLICCCFGPVLSIPGLILSWVALDQINRDPLQTGRGMAIAGIILSLLGLVSLAFSLLSGLFSSAWQIFSVGN